MGLIAHFQFTAWRGVRLGRSYICPGKYMDIACNSVLITTNLLQAFSFC